MEKEQENKTKKETEKTENSIRTLSIATNDSRDLYVKLFCSSVNCYLIFLIDSGSHISIIADTSLTPS